MCEFWNVWILIFVRIFNKESQFLVISAQMFILMLNTWTDLNSYILYFLMSYCRKSDNVTCGNACVLGEKGQNVEGKSKK